MTTRETQTRKEPARRADPAGNERLTAMTGAVLLVLFVAECLTLLNIGNLLTLHVFLGMLLLGPVGLKIGSTLWRFARYIPARRLRCEGSAGSAAAGDGAVRHLDHRGRPGHRDHAGRRGPGQRVLGQLHHLSFFLWAFFMVIHLASYVPKLPRKLSGRADHARHLLATRATRRLLLCGSLVARPRAGVRHLSPLGQIWRLAQHHPVNPGAWPFALVGLSPTACSPSERIGGLDHETAG